MPLPAAPAGLADYRRDTSVPGTWSDFRDYKGGAAYSELTEALTNVQHRLCCYCEIDLRDRDRQVEHFVPRSDPSRGAQLALAPSNLLACCQGGNSIIQSDADRRLPPVGDNLSCGQAKENKPATMFVDPRSLPALPSIARVTIDGLVEPDPDACRKTGHDPVEVATTIARLGRTLRDFEMPVESTGEL